MKLILKENEKGYWCIFDPRSNQFMQGSCCRTKPSAENLLIYANSIIRKSLKNLFEIAESPVYGDTGYLATQIARNYIQINPDLKDKLTEKLTPKIDKKTQLKKNKKKLLKEKDKRTQRKKKDG